MRQIVVGESHLGAEERDRPEQVDPHEEQRQRGEAAEDRVIARRAHDHAQVEVLEDDHEHGRHAAAEHRGERTHARVGQEPVEERKGDREHHHRSLLQSEIVEQREEAVGDQPLHQPLAFERRRERECGGEQQRRDHQHRQIVGELPREAALLAHAPDRIQRALHVADAEHRRHEQRDRAQRPQAREIDALDPLEDVGPRLGVPRRQLAHDQIGESPADADRADDRDRHGEQRDQREHAEVAECARAQEQMVAHEALAGHHGELEQAAQARSGSARRQLTVPQAFAQEVARALAEIGRALAHAAPLGGGDPHVCSQPTGSGRSRPRSAG